MLTLTEIKLNLKIPQGGYLSTTEHPIHKQTSSVTEASLVMVFPLHKRSEIPTLMYHPATSVF
jgi:hypothetical protein